MKPNLQIKVVNVQSRPGELSTLLRGLEGSAIIYVLTKKEAEQLTADVRKASILTINRTAIVRGIYS